MVKMEMESVLINHDSEYINTFELFWKLTSIVIVWYFVI